MIKMYVVRLSFKRGVFVLRNSLPLWDRTVYLLILHPKWTLHFISYTDFEHTLVREKSTKRCEKLHRLS